MLSSYYVWRRIRVVRVGNVGSQKTPGIFFILGVNVYICSIRVKLTPFNLSLGEGFG
jgi:hypothetical protein